MRKIFIITIIVFSAQVLCGQNINEKPPTQNNFFFVGGNLGLAFGTVTSVDIAPNFGYFFNKYFSLGLGGIYQHYGVRSSGYSMNILGGRGFLRVHPFPQIFLQGEYELLTYKTDAFSNIRKKETILNENLLAGIGYKQDIGGQLGSYIMLLYNFNQTIRTPYNNPVIRVGIEYKFSTKKNKQHLNKVFNETM